MALSLTVRARRHRALARLFQSGRHRASAPLSGSGRGRASAPLLAGSAALVALLAAGATAFAVPVRGTLEIPRDAQPARSEADRPDHYWRVWNGVLEPRPEQMAPNRELAIVLTGGAGGDPVGCEYALHGGALEPSTLVIKQGTTLRIENHDGCSHFLYADGVDVFERLETPPGNARAVPIADGGPWVIRDAVHPHVQGTLHALPDLVACGDIDARGAYVFPSVPAGTYTLKVYRGADELASQELTVAEGRELVVPPVPLTLPSTQH
jgi:hypothetical protein